MLKMSKRWTANLSLDEKEVEHWHIRVALTEQFAYCLVALGSMHCHCLSLSFQPNLNVQTRVLTANVDAMYFGCQLSFFFTSV
jgi:hypothetical protein